MKNQMGGKYIIYGVILSLFAACAPSPYPYRAQTPPPSSYHPPPPPPVPTATPPATKTITIISDPPGAHIEVNDDYLGDAPITVTVPQHDNRFEDRTVIRATPTQAGDYTQTKFFNGPFPGVSEGDPIPSRILFSMNLGPATPAVDVNVNPSQ